MNTFSFMLLHTIFQGCAKEPKPGKGPRWSPECVEEICGNFSSKERYKKVSQCKKDTQSTFFINDWAKYYIFNSEVQILQKDILILFRKKNWLKFEGSSPNLIFFWKFHIENIFRKDFHHFHSYFDFTPLSIAIFSLTWRHTLLHHRNISFEKNGRMCEKPNDN